MHTSNCLYMSILALFFTSSLSIAASDIVEYEGMVDPPIVTQGQTSEFSIWVQNLGDTNLHLDFTSYFEFTDANNISYVGTLKHKPRVITKGASHSSTAFADLDNDGDLDMLLGGPGGEICYYRNDGSTAEPLWRLANSNILGEKPDIEFTPNLVDIDNDGDQDLFLGGQNPYKPYESMLRFYENTGGATVPEFSLVTEDYFPEILGNHRPILEFVDIDADSDYDLFFGTATPSKLWYYRNYGSPASPAFTLVTDSFIDLSIYSEPAPAFVDIDDDGDFDLFIGTKNKAIVFFENTGTSVSPAFTFITENYGADVLSTVTNHLDFVDLDSDGDFDLYAFHREPGGMGRRYLTHYENIGPPAVADWQVKEEKVKYDDNVIGTGSNLAWILQFEQANVPSDMLVGIYNPTLYLAGTDTIGNPFSTILLTNKNPVTVLSSKPSLSGLNEVPNSVSPSTVHQWLKPSFTISVENVDEQDIRLSTDTKLGFGTGTGQEYSANLVNEVLIEAGTTEVLTLEREVVCGTLLVDKVYNPYLVLAGEFVSSEIPYSQILYTQSNPIEVTYMELRGSNSAGVSHAGEIIYLVSQNGGWLDTQDGPATWTWQMKQNVPGEMRITFPDPGQGDPGFDFDMRLDPRWINRYKTSIIDLELNPPYKTWTVLIDNYDYDKMAVTNLAVYPREDTLLNSLYEGRMHMRLARVIYDCPVGGGSGVSIIGGIATSYKITFDDNVDLDITAVECSENTLRYGEVLDVNVFLETDKVYPIRIDSSPDQTFLKFTSGGTDVSSYFEVLDVTGVGWAFEDSQTDVLTFTIRPICAVSLGEVTIDPTVSYNRYFADGDGVIKLSGQDTGSSCPSPVTGSFNMVSNISGVVYVDSAALPGGDGSSWETAYQSIQVGINAACCGDQVWVACGTYFEGVVMKDDAELYGGFAGTETSLEERYLAANPTIIDASTANSGNPADHVVTMDCITNARIDGFTITGGVADGSYLTDDDKGGGIFCRNLDNTNIIANCTINGNSAAYRAGAVYCGDSSPTIAYCTISKNSDGGVYCHDSWVNITCCAVSGNLGNGVHCIGKESSITNCLISCNSESGVYCCWTTSPIITNCTISGNFIGVNCKEQSSTTLTNCIVWGNSYRQIYVDSKSTALVTYSNVQGSWPGNGNIDDDPLFLRNPSLGPNVIWDRIEDYFGDPHLCCDSPCLDSGTNTTDPPLPETDLEGNPRIIDEFVDMGAYEGPKQGLVILGEPVRVPEGATATFTVALACDPLGPVDVTVIHHSGDADISIESGDVLVFNSTNFWIPQTVVLSAAPDDDAVEDTALIRCSAEGWEASDVIVGEGEDDTLSILVDTPSVMVPEGGIAEFKVKLDSKPISDVIISVARYSGDTDISVITGLTLTFTPSDWDIFQFVTLAADHDTDPVDNSAIIRCSAVGWIDADVLATEDDDEGLYVKQDAQGNSDGSSWTDAFNYLQDALAYADSLSGPVEIWVAHGIYRPDSNSADPNGSGNRNATFKLIDGVSIYGGFAGHEIRRDGRDIVTNQTILSGDLNGDDGPNFSNYIENSYHVVTGGHNVILDGFIITGGNADAPFSPDESGAGMINRYCQGLTVENCTFIANSAKNGGGGIKNTQSDVKLINCAFIMNSAMECGGGAHNGRQSNCLFSRCTFSANSCLRGGGLRNDSGSTMLINCNLLANDGKWGSAIQSYNETILNNCIVWDNVNTSIYGSVVAMYSDIKGGWPGIGNINVDPCFVDPNVGDYHLKSEGWRWDINSETWVQDAVTSPCIDAGNPGMKLGDEHLTIPDDPNNDFGENLRINMGAYGGTTEASIAPYGWAILADLTNDAVVDYKDFAYTASDWAAATYEKPGDLDRNGILDWSDVAILAEHWLQGAGP